MNPTKNAALSVTNSHPNDLKIKKIRAGQYQAQNSKLCSVTEAIKTIFPKFDADSVIKNIMNDAEKWNESHKYWGMEPYEIKNLWTTTNIQSSTAGTNLHKEIEDFLDKSNHTHKTLLPYLMESTSTDPAFQEFANFVVDYPDLQPYRVEWEIYDMNSRIAGTIDAVYLNDDGTVSLYDWKRKKEISKYDFGCKIKEYPFEGLSASDYEKCRLQLSFYKFILEKNYGLKVASMYLVRVYPDELYERIEVKMNESVSKWFEARSNKKT